MRPLASQAHDLADLGPLGWVLLGLAVLVVVWVIWRAVRLTIHPREDAPDHIKRSILEDGPAIGGGGGEDDAAARGAVHPGPKSE